MKKYIFFVIALPATFTLLTMFGVFDVVDKYGIGSARLSTPDSIGFLAFLLALVSVIGIVAFFIAKDSLSETWATIYKQDNIVKAFTDQLDELKKDSNAVIQQKSKDAEVVNAPVAALIEQMGNIRIKIAGAIEVKVAAYRKLEVWRQGPWAFMERKFSPMMQESKVTEDASTEA
ncbi:MAG: hypothetical protein KAS32_25095 [Candidatus Peribacteraceae bacterium]|nr:hypothetical protein [Candidatus Peribacteraceae bacterium]